MHLLHVFSPWNQIVSLRNYIISRTISMDLDAVPSQHDAYARLTLNRQDVVRGETFIEGGGIKDTIKRTWELK